MSNYLLTKFNQIYNKINKLGWVSLMGKTLLKKKENNKLPKS